MGVLALAIFSAGLVIATVRSVGPWLLRSSSRNAGWQQAEASRNRLLQANQEEIIFDAAAKRPAYLYSVVPGGIVDGADLKRVAAHDPVVAAHYAGFDYDHARIVRLTLAQTVFLSYRVGNHVYWTRHRVTLHPGETLITDGRKSARTKCGNRVEAAPQAATSPAEPPMEKFDQPARPATAQTAPPATFESSLFNRPGVPGTEPGPPSLITPGGGVYVPIFPPVIPHGSCGAGEKNDHDADDKGKKNPCGPPEAVPEPGTIWLFATGLALAGLEVGRRRALVPVLVRQLSTR